MEESTKPQHKQHAPKAMSKAVKITVSAVVVLVVAVVGFFSGVQYQKGKKTAATASNGQFQNFGGGANGFGGQGMMRRGEIGTVTAISSSSISVKNGQTSEDKTYTIGSSTTITKDGSTATYSDIAVGDTVLVESSDSSTANSIVINPNLNGGPQMNSSSDTTTQTN